MCIHVQWKHSKMSMHQYFILFPQLLAIQCVWQYGFIWQFNFLFSSSLWHSVFLSLCLWGSKVCQLCSGSTCSTAICIFIFTFIVAENAGLSASACRGNELCNKNAQAAQREGEEERETHSILVTLCQRFYSWKPTRSSSFKAVKHVFAERNRNEVSFLWSCLLVVRVACHIVEPNIMAILRAGLKETQAEQSRAEESVSS